MPAPQLGFKPPPGGGATCSLGQVGTAALGPVPFPGGEPPETPIYSSLAAAATVPVLEASTLMPGPMVELSARRRM
jgi:hypothetical protein